MIAQSKGRRIFATMEIIKTTIVLFISCAALITASPVAVDGEVVSLRLIRHQSDHRVRRDAGESSMPDVLVMQFSLGGENVILRLQRSRYPPMFLTGKDGLREITGLNDDSSSVYADPSRGASFMVKKSPDGQFLLDGNLRHHGNQMDMKPVARRKRAAGDDYTHTVMTAVPDFIEFEHQSGLDADGDLDLDLDDALEDGEKPTEEMERKVVNRRRKRQAATQHTVETAFVIDHTDYAAWQTRFPNSLDLLAEIRSYYTYIGLTLNNIYASVKDVDPTMDIKVPITALYVVDSASDVITEEADGQLEGREYLDDFIAWIPTQTNLPSSDHYMAFTAYDVTFSGGEAVGVAESAQVCTGRSTSVVENSKSSVANIAAHELGHTLSAAHDGTGNVCPPNLQNVMTPGLFVPTQDPATPRNIFQFSACSVASFKTYLAGTTCTLSAETAASVALPFTDFNYELITDRDKQCQEAINDATSYYCSPDRFPDFNEEDICIGMLCALPEPQQGQCRYVLPFEGTSCGTGKICSRGLCEDAATVSQASATFDKPTTAAPTTQPPTTEAPTTQAPSTEAPTTQAPTTEAPTTQAPTTEAPTTQAPTTEAPTTQAPTTEAPTTQDPTTEAPTTQAPTTEAPTTQAPTTEAPTTQAPTTQASTTQAPTTEAPSTQDPTTQAPATESTTAGQGEANEPTTAAAELETPAPTTPAPLPLGCTRCSRRTYNSCLRYWYFSRWFRFPLSRCCQACLSYRRWGRRQRYDD